MLWICFCPVQGNLDFTKNFRKKNFFCKQNKIFVIFSDLLVNLNEARSLVHQLLEELPNMFKDTNETFSGKINSFFLMFVKCPKNIVPFHTEYRIEY